MISKSISMSHTHCNTTSRLKQHSKAQFPCACTRWILHSSVSHIVGLKMSQLSKCAFYLITADVISGVRSHMQTRCKRTTHSIQLVRAWNTFKRRRFQEEQTTDVIFLSLKDSKCYRTASCKLVAQLSWDRGFDFRVMLKLSAADCALSG